MQPNIDHTIERYLDQQLGMWTRLLPWRHEMAIHLQEALETSQSDSTEKDNGDKAWQSALASFGNVEEVARQLRDEHWPQYIGWRLLATVVALSVVFSIANPWTLLDLPSLGFAILPATAFVCFDTFRGSTRWAIANRIGTWGCVCGALAGIVYILIDFGSPSSLGAGMALSILSALYCMLFFTPHRMIVLSMVGVSLIVFALMLIQFHMWSVAEDSPAFAESYSPQNWGVDRAWVIRTLAILGGGISLGIARFGFHSITRHAPSVGAGIFLVNLVVMLGDMSDPSKVIGHLVVALSVMVLAVACCHCVSTTSRLTLRLMR